MFKRVQLVSKCSIIFICTILALSTYFEDTFQCTTILASNVSLNWQKYWCCFLSVIQSQMYTIVFLYYC